MADGTGCSCANRLAAASNAGNKTRTGIRLSPVPSCLIWFLDAPPNIWVADFCHSRYSLKAACRVVKPKKGKCCRVGGADPLVLGSPLGTDALVPLFARRIKP